MGGGRRGGIRRPGGCGRGDGGPGTRRRASIPRPDHPRVAQRHFLLASRLPSPLTSSFPPFLASRESRGLRGGPAPAQQVTAPAPPADPRGSPASPGGRRTPRRGRTRLGRSHSQEGRKVGREEEGAGQGTAWRLARARRPLPARPPPLGPGKKGRWEVGGVEESEGLAAAAEATAGPGPGGERPSRGPTSPCRAATLPPRLPSPPSLPALPRFRPSSLPASRDGRSNRCRGPGGERPSRGPTSRVAQRHFLLASRLPSPPASSFPPFLASPESRGGRGEGRRGTRRRASIPRPDQPRVAQRHFLLASRLPSPLASSFPGFRVSDLPRFPRVQRWRGSGGGVRRWARLPRSRDRGRRHPKAAAEGGGWGAGIRIRR